MTRLCKDERFGPESSTLAVDTLKMDLTEFSKISNEILACRLSFFSKIMRIIKILLDGLL